MSGETSFTHPVVVVREDATEPVVGHAITFHIEIATCNPAAPILFTLRSDATDGAGGASSLEITPDRITSLTRTVHDHTTQLVADSPPCMDIVRQHLGVTPNLTRLQFQLRNHGRLVSSVGGTPPAAIMALTDALTFSVYLPNNALPKAQYNSFYRVVRTYLDATQASRRPELPPITKEDGYRAHDQAGDVSSPPGYASDNDTVAATTPSGYGPPDDEELPGYPDDESDHSTSVSKNNIRKRHLRRSSEASRVTSKRSRLRSPDAEAFVDTESPSPPAKLDYFDSRLRAVEVRMRLQDQRIETLEAENKHFKDRNLELERRVAELESNVRDLQGLEDRVEELGEQHEVMEETLANVDVHQDELDADCSRLGLELAEIRDMSRDAIIDEINDKVQESLGDMVTMYREELKRKLISALQEE